MLRQQSALGFPAAQRLDRDAQRRRRFIYADQPLPFWDGVDQVWIDLKQTVSARRRRKLILRNYADLAFVQDRYSALLHQDQIRTSPPEALGIWRPVF